MFVTSPKCVIFVAYYSYEGVLIALPTYSPKCLEEVFCEVRIHGVLRSSSASFVLWSTYSYLTKEYAAFVTWPVDAA